MNIMRSRWHFISLHFFSLHKILNLVGFSYYCCKFLQATVVCRVSEHLKSDCAVSCERKSLRNILIHLQIVVIFLCRRAILSSSKYRSKCRQSWIFCTSNIQLNNHVGISFDDVVVPTTLIKESGNTRIIAIGVGDVDPNLIYELASGPDSEFAIRIPGFDDLASITDSVAQQIRWEEVIVWKIILN